MTGILDAEARQLVRRVQELRDERDELLDLLGVVFDGHQGELVDATFATIPAPVWQEIRRRVVGRDS